MKLNELKAGETATITSVMGTGALRQHFLDMGLIPEAEITLVRFAPLGDPIEFRIHGYELTLRLDDARNIEIRDVHKASEARKTVISAADREHPGLGEAGRYHEMQPTHNEPLQGTLTFALVGNQNSGKTTLFNQLTGSNQHVGNFPGVTVDRKSGAIRKHPDTDITDLPGIYSLSPYSSEELISRNFILEEKPNAIINVVDATNLERNLYLTVQLMELDIPMVLALNMMDEMEGNGGEILINEMEDILQIPVVPISALKNQGVDELISHAIHVARYQETPGRQDFCDRNDHGGALHRCLHSIMHIIEDHCEQCGLPKRFAAGKLVEDDQYILQQLNLSEGDKAAVERLVREMEESRRLDRSAAMAEMRYLFIQRLCERTVIKPAVSREHARSHRLDTVLTGKYTAIPVFIAVMGLTFYLTFNVIGAFFQGLLEQGIDQLTLYVDGLLTAANVNPALHALIVDGIFAGVGSVLSFLPIIITLFFFLSMLEDSGYMARVAFFMDKLLRKIGLSGRSIVPMLIGFGCSVPAVMASRTLPSERDRKMTILLIPFMSCSAKLPIYAFFTAAFFPKAGWLVMVGLYFIGILVAIITALIFKKTLFQGEAVPFVMELPNYRLPGARNVVLLMWEKAKDFLQRAFTVIFVGTIVVWFLKSFDPRFNLVENSEGSILYHLASLISPLLKPLGFGDWRVAVSLISGFLAKESVVSTLQVLYGPGNAIASQMSGAVAFGLLVFCLLYTPCVAAVAAIRRELGRKDAIRMVIFQCAVAWICAFIVRLVVLVTGIA